MNRFLWILLVLGLFYLGRWFYRALDSNVGPGAGERRQEAVAASASDPVLPGMPATLESTLESAKKQGPEALSAFLRSYGHHIRDPRLAQIELDYVVLVSRQDPAEARRVFAAVRQRVRSGSPVYERVKSLEKTFGF